MSQPGSAIRTVVHDGSVSAIAFSADSTRFASGGGGTKVLVRAVQTGPELDIPVNGFVSSIAFSPDGATLALADLDRVAAHSASNGTLVWDGAIEAATSVNFVAFTPDGKQLIATTDTRIAVLDAGTGAQILPPIVVDQTIADVDLSKDGKLLVVAVDERHGGNHRHAGSARVFDLTTGTERSRKTPDDAVHAVAFSPDASMVLFGSADGTTRMFKSDDGTQLWQVPEDLEREASLGSTHVAYDPTGRWTVVGGADDSARILEAESGVENTFRLEHAGAVTHVAFSPNGKWAASAAIDNVVQAINVATGVKRFPPQNTDEVLALRFSSDSRWLGVGHFNKAVVLDVTGGAG
jgi:WD40 repeat protein